MLAIERSIFLVTIFGHVVNGFFDPFYNAPKFDEEKQLVSEIKAIQELQMRIQVILTTYQFLLDMQVKTMKVYKRCSERHSICLRTSGAFFQE